MTAPWRELFRWIRRARSPLATTLSALGAGTAAAVTSLALFVGAPYLLAYSSTHSKLVAGGTLAVLLVVIELFAFLRSPLRFFERMSAHSLGLRSVTQWRRWLLNTIGSWNFARWRAASNGDLLERAMTDTDALQDLWLRSLIPLITTSLAFFCADIVVGALSTPNFHSARVALVLIASQTAILVALMIQLPRLVRIEAAVRAGRAARSAQRIELQLVAPEIELLGRSPYLSESLAEQNQFVSNLEDRRTDRWRWVRLVVALSPLVTLLVTSISAGGIHHLGGRFGLVVVLVAAATIELALVASHALRFAVSVTASAERLDQLAQETRERNSPWPQHELINVTSLSWSEADHPVLRDVNFTVPTGRRVAITGATGSGKSTLLRLLARLDETGLGEITIGEVPLGSIEEGSLRLHLGFVSADPGLLEGNLDAVLRVGRVSGDDSDSAIRRLGVVAKNAGRLEHLSRGEAQRVALVRGLLSDPSVVLLDEPTAGLGALERRLVLQRLSELRSTLIIATHDDELVQWCDEQYELRDGQLLLVTR